MKKSTAAALLSAFVFPGIGHFYLRCPARGLALLAIAAAALADFVLRLWREAQLMQAALIDEINAAGFIDLQMLIAHALAAADRIERQPFTIAALALLACWLIGIVDSLRIGRKLDAAATS